MAPGTKRSRSPVPEQEPDRPVKRRSTPDASDTVRELRPWRPQTRGPAADAYYRTLYTKDPDFRQLAREDPDFANVLKHRQLDFNDPASVVQLTKTLLAQDFGLKIDLPSDRLCPPVPNRHNYILWLKDLLDTSSYGYPSQRYIYGLDIGTGASCIYPLLGCTQRDWNFIATDIDEKSLEYAAKNIAANDLTSRITLLPSTPTSPLIPLDHPSCPVKSLSFVMTNPPFYESQEELTALALQKSRPPLTACTGSANEMVTPGGEVAFTSRILEESLLLRERVQWYTTMLGKHSSVGAMVDMLKAKGIDNYAVTEFVQGSKTRRWAVGWSFGAMRPAQITCRGMSQPAWMKALPHAVEYEVASIPLGIEVESLGRGVDKLLGELELMSWEWDQKTMAGIGRARENVWSRAWRRKKMRMGKDGGEGEVVEGATDDGACAFGFKVSIVVGLEGVRVSLRWTEGHDAAILESLLGFLRTRVAGIVKSLG